MKLYHFSNADTKVLTVDTFGQNSFTSESVRVSGVKRTFFYLEAKPIEKHFFGASKFLYVVDIPKKELYDFRKDTKGYLKKFDTNTHEFYQYISKRYTGIIYYTVSGFTCVAVFKNVKPCRKENRYGTL